MKSFYPDSSGKGQVNNPEFNKEGKNEKRAVSSASQALQIARRIHDDDMKRDSDRARVLAAFNGAAPYDQSELESVGQSYRFNVSFGHLEGVIGRCTTPYLDIVNDDQYIANIDADLPEPKLSIMREELSLQIKNWGKWARTTSRLVQDLVINGYNTVLFPSDYDPFPVFAAQKHGLTHDMSGNDSRDIEVYIWVKNYMIHELYEMIEDPEVAKKAGWNVENCRAAIEDATPERILEMAQSGSWTATEEAIRAGTLYASVTGDKKINVYHVLAKEMSGKVSHWIVLRDNNENGDSGSDSPNVELFKRLDRFDSMESVVIYFDLEAGDGKWHGSRGLGKRAFNTHRAVDKLRCSVLDQAFTSGLTILQAQDQDSQEDFQLAVVGPFAVIPAGTTVSATTVPAISATTFQVDALLSSTSEQRIGDVVPNTSSPTRHGSKTATEADISNDRAMMISKANLQRFVAPLSQMLSIIVLRLLIEDSPDKYAQEYQRRLKEKGFTREDFDKVRGAKSTGNIDKVLGTERANYTTIVQIYRGDPDIQQKEMKRRHLESIVGPKEVHGLIIDEEDKVIGIEAQRAQLEELSSMENGFDIPISPRDNHEIHAMATLQELQDQFKMAQSGKPGAQLPTIQKWAEHASGHIKAMEADPSKKANAQKLLAGLKEIMFSFQHLVQQAQRQPPQAPTNPVQ